MYFFYLIRKQIFTKCYYQTLSAFVKIYVILACNILSVWKKKLFEEFIHSGSKYLVLPS